MKFFRQKWLLEKLSLGCRKSYEILSAQVMSEFNNRIVSQRDALKIVNGTGRYNEPLLSLTEKAINRWVASNGIDGSDTIISLLKSLSGTLFFLGNKSQEQISEDYKVLSKKVSEQLSLLKIEMTNKALQRTSR
jgi:hypothetical protein